MTISVPPAGTVIVGIGGGGAAAAAAGRARGVGLAAVTAGGVALGFALRGFFDRPLVFAIGLRPPPVPP